MKEIKSAPEISVIIAMYNAADFIEECLQSVLNQTFKNFEVIVVDDCSTDNSVEVVQKMAANFGGRLTLIKTNKNSGCAGIPRNLALNEARGKYIYFLDSDDFIDENAFESLCNVAEEYDADVVHCEKYFECVDGEDRISSWQLSETIDKTTLEMADTAERVNKFIQKKFLWNPWGKLFNRKFLVENKIQFSDMTSFEDMVFIFCCLMSAKKYVRVPFAHYHYRIRANSLSHAIDKPDVFVKTAIQAVKNLDEFMLTKKFFIENPQSRFSVIDFFVLERINIFSNDIMSKHLDEAGEIFAWLHQHVFSKNVSESSALTSYLFILANIYSMALKFQSKKIADLEEELKNFRTGGNF